TSATSAPRRRGRTGREARPLGPRKGAPGMLRAFSAAVSGMRTQMTFMDTVANNIANVNTTAFKTTRARFSDMLYQTLGQGIGATDNLGSHGPAQVGLGVKMAAIDTNMGQGALRATNNPLDLAIEG